MGVSREFAGQVLGVQAAAFTRLFSACRSQAKRRGKGFALTREQYVEVACQDCAYCGAPPSNRTTIDDEAGEFVYSYQGVDRVDNASGYEPGNVVACCADCNRSKGTRRAGDFIGWARRVASAAP